MLKYVWNIAPKGMRDWLYNKVLSIAHMPEALDVDKLTDFSISASINIIRNRFPDQDIYLISDRINKFSGLIYIGPTFVNKGQGAIYLCVMSSIKLCENAARAVAATQGFYYFPLRAHPPARYFEFDPVALECLHESARLPRSHYDAMDYENIIQAINNCLNIEGSFVEIGTFEGRSSQIILDYLKRRGIKRDLFCLDTYCGMVFESASKSSDAHWFGTHTSTAKNTIEAVGEFLAPYGNPTLIKVDITKDEIPSEIGKIAFCNLDVDMHEAYLCALNKVHDRIAIGGIILLEDYGHSPYILGAKLAVDDFFTNVNKSDYVEIYLSSGQLMLVRLK